MEGIFFPFMSYDDESRIFDAISAQWPHKPGRTWPNVTMIVEMFSLWDDKHLPYKNGDRFEVYGHIIGKMVEVVDTTLDFDFIETKFCKYVTPSGIVSESYPPDVYDILASLESRYMVELVKMPKKPSELFSVGDVIEVCGSGPWSWNPVINNRAGRYLIPRNHTRLYEEVGQLEMF